MGSFRQRWSILIVLVLFAVVGAVAADALRDRLVVLTAAAAGAAGRRQSLAGCHQSGAWGRACCKRPLCLGCRFSEVSC